MGGSVNAQGLRRALPSAGWLCAVLLPAVALASAAAVEGAGDLDTQWREALQLETEAEALDYDEPEAAVVRYTAASQRFERVAGKADARPSALWRSARCAWLAGDSLPLEDAKGRVRSFTRAQDLALRGLERNPECAECMLWQFASMGRLRTTLGVWKGIRQVGDMAALLDRAIALQPTYADNEWNSTLGNLYYTSAIFYRVLPDWFWMKWFAGVRGDKDRALQDIHTALALHPTRFDYVIELGSQLLCQGASSWGKKDRLEAGREVLERALLAESKTRDDERDREAARIMLKTPAMACGYTGDTWVDLSEFEPQDS